MNNNKGFSLIEVLVVIAIMSVMTGLAALSISLVHNANVNDACNKIESALSSARVTSMAKGQEAGKITFIMDGGSLYYTIGDDPTRTRVTTGSITVTTNNVPKCPSASGAAWADGVSYTYKFNSAGMLVDSDSSPCCIILAHKARHSAVWVYRETGKIETGMFYL